MRTVLVAFGFICTYRKDALQRRVWTMASLSTSVSSVATGSHAPAYAASRLPRGVVLALALVYSIWSSTYLALRYMVQDMPPLASSGARFLLAGAILYSWLRARGAAAPSGKQWLLCLATGSAMFFIGNGFVAIASREVPSGMTAMSTASVPLFLSAVEAAMGQRPSLRQSLGLTLGFAGVACMGAATAAFSSSALWLLVLAPVGWAAASLFTRRCELPSGPIAAACQLIGGGVSLLLGGLAMGERLTAMPQLSSLLAFVYLVVFGSIIAYSAAVYLRRRRSPPATRMSIPCSRSRWARRWAASA
jgi:drug/metabolite transporter (DMT)-like permease